jgi:hypothetical protein
MPSLVLFHPFQLPARWNLTRPNNTCNHIIKARLCILVLRRLNRRVILHHQTLDMRGFLAGGVLLLKSNKEYVLTFIILAQVLVGYHF